MMNRLAKQYPDRRPGIAGRSTRSPGRWQSACTSDGFSVSTSASGPDRRREADARERRRRPPGLTPGAIVVVAHRDALQLARDRRACRARRVLEELARDALGRDASTTRSCWRRPAARAAPRGRSSWPARCPGPVDAVIVLGDLAGGASASRSSCRGQTIRWWRRRSCATRSPPRSPQQARAVAGGVEPGGQFAHLAFPFTATEQGPFGAEGQPAVLLSVSGERAPAADEPVSAARIAAMGRTVLQAVNALDGRHRFPGRRPICCSTARSSRPGRSGCSCSC